MTAAKLSDRDPRVDPQVGDELTGPKSHRIVQRVDSDGAIGFTYFRVRDGQIMWGYSGNDAFTSLKTWRKWAALACVDKETECQTTK